MLFSQAGVAVGTGAGFALLLAALQPGEQAMSPVSLVVFGSACLVVAALLDFVGMTTSFAIRWRIQSRLRDEVIDRARDHRGMLLPLPLRPNSVIGVASAAGIGAAHTGWMTQLLLNGLMPLLVAFALAIAISLRAPLVLLAMFCLLAAIIPLVWLQVKRVSSAAEHFLTSASEKTKALRRASQDAIDGIETERESMGGLEAYEQARRARMTGVQWLRLGTGVLVGIAIGGCVLLLRERPLELTELAILIALLRAALIGIVGVARASGNAARVQPKAEQLRRTLDPAPALAEAADGVDSITVHGVEPPDWLACIAAVAHHLGGFPSAGIQVEEDGLRVRTASDARWISVRADDRKGNEQHSDLHLAITPAGEVQAWDPRGEIPWPSGKTDDGAFIESDDLEDEESEPI